MKCKDCGKEFFAGNRPDGTPNGVGFVREDKTVEYYCAECIEALGKKVRETKIEQNPDERIAYALLIHRKNDIGVLVKPSTADIIRRTNGFVVMDGYNMFKYISCLAFKTRLNRDKCAQLLEQIGIDFDTRDDALVDKRYFEDVK